MQGRQNQESSSKNSSLPLSPDIRNSSKISISASEPSTDTSLIKELWLYRTPFEKSKYSCVENFLRGTAQSFAIGFSIKVALSFFHLLIGPEKLSEKPKKLLEIITKTENLKFGSFLGVLTGVLKLTITLLRILRKKDDGINYFLASFLGAYLSLFLLPKQSRAILGLFLLPRAFDCCYNHLANNKKLKRRSWHFVLLFALMNMFTVYNYTSEEYLIPHSIEKFYNMVLCPSENDLIIRKLCSEIARRSLVKRKIIQNMCSQ